MTSPGEPSPMRWEVLSATMTGASHSQTGKANQDAVATYPCDGAAETVVLAVADGHGSEAYRRSDVGSRIAAEVAVRLGTDFAVMAQEESLVALKSVAEDAMPRDLARQWREMVRAHLRDNPLDGDRLRDGEADASGIAAYGTTLLGTVILRDLMVCWQLGDGNILLVSEDGEVAAPLAGSAPTIGLETDSLLAPQAWRDFRTHWAPLDGSTVLVVLSTDGLANSFKTERDFRAFGSDLLRELKTNGVAATRERLPRWLKQATDFSGDDVTVAAAWRLAPTPSMQSQAEV